MMKEEEPQIEQQRPRQSRWRCRYGSGSVTAANAHNKLAEVHIKSVHSINKYSASKAENDNKKIWLR